MNSRKRLAGKVIVVIGGTSGLGLSAATAFAAEGARLVVVGRDPAKVTVARKKIGRGVLGLAGDAMDSKTAPEAIRIAVERFGRLDGLYHVAGGSGRRHGDGPLHALTDEGLEFTLRENLHSLIYSNRAAVRQFLEQRSGGSVLNMGSVLATSPSPHFFATHAYAAAKAAVVGLTKSAAACYADRDIRFNAVLPALVDTPMARRAVEDAAIMRFVATKQPLDGGRAGHPADLDAAALFFLSDESRYVTGQILAVDGGWSVTEGRIPTTKPRHRTRSATRGSTGKKPKR
jgi:NAD(P)-dependent dehydrogenase (short-subunit alcohol dehydrogenase family)